MRVGQSSTRKTTRCGAGPGRRGKPEAEGRNPTRNGPPSRGPGSSEDGPGAVDRRLRPPEQVRAEVDTISWSPDTSGKRFPHAEIRGRPDSDRAFSAMGSSCDSPAVHAVFDKTTKHCPPPGFQLPDAGFPGARASRPHRRMAGLRPACGRDARVPRMAPANVDLEALPAGPPSPCGLGLLCPQKGLPLSWPPVMSIPPGELIRVPRRTKNGPGRVGGGLAIPERNG